MAEGITRELLIAAIAVGLVAALLSWRTLGLPLASLVAAIKLFIPFAYFAWFYDGSWNLLDDLSYVEQGLYLRDSGFDPITVFFSPEGRLALFNVSGGAHIIYPWWNMVAISVFGEHYYSPVFLNVGLTFIAAWVLSRTLGLVGFEKRYRQAFFVFFLIHWDIIAWSSFLNLKDTLVMTLTIVNFWLLYEWVVRRAARGIPLLGGICLTMAAFLWIRFYIPLLILAALAVWLILENRSRVAHWFLLAGVIGFAGAEQFLYAEYWPLLDFSNIAVSSFRALLTPRPWNIEEEYTFLLVPAIFHWALILPTLIGAVLLWKRSRFERLLIIYLVLVIFVCSFVPEVQGPRQRFQVAFILARMQFEFFWNLILAPLRDKSKHRALTARPIHAPVSVAATEGA